MHQVINILLQDWNTSPHPVTLPINLAPPPPVGLLKKSKSINRKGPKEIRKGPKELIVNILSLSALRIP